MTCEMSNGEVRVKLERRGQTAASPRAGVQQPQPERPAHHDAGATVLSRVLPGLAAAGGVAAQAAVRVAAGMGSALPAE